MRDENPETGSRGMRLGKMQETVTVLISDQLRLVS
jgi:hypothetical protein